MLYAALEVAEKLSEEQGIQTEPVRLASETIRTLPVFFAESRDGLFIKRIQCPRLYDLGLYALFL